MSFTHSPDRGANLIVLGFRAAGVADVACAVAEQLGLALVDTAERIAEGTGFSVAEIGEAFGEHRLRALEARMARDLPALRGAVILPARGMLEDQDARANLRRSGHVFYVRPGREDLVRRFLRQAARVPASGWVFDVAAEAGELYDRLDPVFRAAADVVLDTGARRADVLASRIASRFTAIGSGVR